jgi:hypothetical protein
VSEDLNVRRRYQRVEAMVPVVLAALMSDGERRLVEGKEAGLIVYAVDLCEMAVAEIDRRAAKAGAFPKHWDER